MEDRQENTTSALTPTERETVRAKKKWLKHRKRIRKYETRLQQALSRGDEVTATRARRELETYKSSFTEDENSILSSQDEISNNNTYLRQEQEHEQQQQQQHPQKQKGGGEEEEGSANFRQGRRWILLIWNKLILQIKKEQQRHSSDLSSTTKQDQTEHARELLHNMGKGTQTESMFNNNIALVGYTRQKFMERALLALKSLNRIIIRQDDDDNNNISNNENNNNNNQNHHHHHYHHHTFFLTKLSRVRRIVSIGCGPGCDVVGALAFLKYYNDNNYSNNMNNSENTTCDRPPIVDSILLMDYAISQWKNVVLDSLIPLLLSSADEKYGPNPTISSRRIQTAYGDVRYSLNSTENADCRSKLLSLVGEGDDRHLLVIVSYLLTETRNQWKEFFSNLLFNNTNNNNNNNNSEKILPPGTIILLSEPTAWQLHIFLKEFKGCIESYIWLDSSRDFPSLQTLEGRMGPAVLLICTRLKDTTKSE